MEGDVHITHEQACVIHQEGMQHGVLVMWVITQNTSDYPDLVVARPNYISGTVDALKEILVAESLGRLRNQLPPGLVCLPPEPNDDPVIVEIWV